MLGRRASLITWFVSLFAVVLAGRPALAADYKIAPGDVLNVTVVGERDYTRSYTVNEEGKISVAHLGSLTVSGKTQDEAAAALKKQLEIILKSPVVLVDVTKYIWVTGEVNKAGKIALQPDARLSYYLKEAGNVKEDSADLAKGVIIRRGQEGRIPLDLKAVIYASDPGKDLLVEAGDTVYVPKKEEGQVNGKVRIFGEVSSPGEKDLKTTNMTPIEAITALAGGFKPSADKAKVVIQHTDGTRAEVDMEASNLLASNVYLADGDLVFVPNKGSGTIKVSGEGVKSPGEYPYQSGMRVMDAVLKAGNFSDEANKEAISVQRADGTTSKINLDKYLREGDMGQNVALQRDDVVLVLMGAANSETNQVEVSGLGVNKPGKYPYEEGMRLMDAVTLAGSFTERAKIKQVSVVHRDNKVDSVNLDKYLNGGDPSYNVPLQKGDIILVGQEKEGGPRQRNVVLDTVLTTLPSILLWRVIR